MSAVQRSVKMEGWAELEDLLRLMPSKIGTKVAVASLRKGAAIIRAEAARLVPVETGELRRSIRVRTFRQKSRAERTVTVWVQGPEKSLAILVEFGTSAHLIKRKRKGGVLGRAKGRLGGIYQGKGLPRGQVMHPGATARPFIRPAFDSRVGQATQAIAQGIREGIEKFIAENRPGARDQATFQYVSDQFGGTFGS